MNEPKADNKEHTDRSQAQPLRKNYQLNHNTNFLKTS